MLADYIDIIKIVMLAMDIIIALILLRFILTGIRRGFARNLFRLILVLILVLFFSIGCKGIIRNIIELELPINIDVYAEEVTIKNIVYTYVADYLFEGDIVALQQSQLTGLVDDITVSAISIVLFTVMSILIYLIIAPIITLFCKIFLPFLRKKRDGVKVQYSGTSKLLGLGCALIRFAILMMIFFVPLYGALEIGTVVVEEAALADEEMKELNDDLNESLGSSVMLKLTSNIGKNKDGVFGFGAKTLGDRLLITTEYANINVVKELDAVGGYLPRAIELAFEMMDEENINEIVNLIEEQDIVTITNYIANSNVIKIAYPVAMNYLNSIEDTLELGVDIDFEELAKIEINKDLEKLQPFFTTLLNCAKKLDLENIDVWMILENKVVVEEALDAVNIILNLDITDKLILKLGTELLNDILEENNLSTLSNLITNDYIKNMFITDIKSIYNAYLLLDANGIIDYILEETEEDFVVTEQLKDDLKEVVNLILNLELIKNQEKKIIEAVLIFTEVDEEIYDGIFDEEIDWTKEVDSVGEIITTLIETALSLDLESLKFENTTDYLALLESDVIVNGVSEILNIALNMQLAEKYVLPLLVEYIEEFLETSELEEFNGIIDAEYIEEHLVDDINQLVDAYSILKETKLLEYFLEEKELEFTENTKEQLLEAFGKIVDLKLIKGNEKQLIAYAVSFVGDDFEIDFEQMLEEDINWSSEIHILLEVVVDVFEFIVTCDFDLENIENLIQNEKFTIMFPNLVDKIFTLEIAEEYLAPVIIKTLNDLLIEMGFEQFADYITVDYLKENLSTDLTNVIEIFNSLKELGLEDMLSGEISISINEEDKEKFKKVIVDLLSLKIIDGHQSELIIMLCDTCGLNSFISYEEEDFENVDWNVETENFANVVMALLNVTNLDNLDENILETENLDETSEQLGDLFDALIKCAITKKIAFELIDNLISNIGYDIDLTEDDKLAIEQNTGKVEVNALMSVAKDALELFSSDDETTDYSALNGEDITKLMLDASEGVIASKVMGTILNEVLGENGLDIMPVDPETGENLYNFTNQNVLREQAVNIGNCVDLVNKLQSFDPENIDSITDIAASLEALGNTEGDNNIVEDLLSEFLPTDSIEIPEDIDWSEEASIVEDVLNLYKETENKDEFEITDSELNERIEESGFAEIILDFLGIFGNN